MGKKKTYDGYGKSGTTLTPKDEITQRLKDSHDPFRRLSYYNQMRYAFGESWRKDGFMGLHAGGWDAFADYPDIFVRFQEVGRSRKILNSQFISLSKVMYSDPDPQFVGCDQYTAAVRRAFFRARWKGDNWDDGEWADQVQAAYMEGDGLGLGFIQICLRTNKDTGKEQVHIRHSQLINTIVDRHARTPAEYRHITFVHYSSPSDAAAMFGPVAYENVRQIWDWDQSRPVDMVRWFEYYDIGFNGGAPTRAVILNEFANPPHLVEENIFGCLPFAYYLHFYAPGMRHPTGRIAVQMPTQEALNEIERAMRKCLRNPPFTIIDPEQLDRDDLRAVISGDYNKFVRWKFKAGEGKVTPATRIPGADVSNTTLSLLKLYDTQFNADSGITDFDRGQNPTSDRTLGENVMVQQNGATQNSWSELQMSKFLRRLVQRVMYVASLYDRDPVRIEIEGKPYIVNLPGNPDSTIDKWMEAPADVTIDAGALRYQDVEYKRQVRMQQLMPLLPLVQAGMIDAKWFTEEIAKALGVTDPKRVLGQALIGVQPMPQMSNSPMQGNPMAPMQQAQPAQQQAPQQASGNFFLS